MAAAAVGGTYKPPQITLRRETSTRSRTQNCDILKVARENGLEAIQGRKNRKREKKKKEQMSEDRKKEDGLHGGREIDFFRRLCSFV